MPFDYSEFQDTAEELVDEFGGDVRLIRRSSSPADPTRPWDGPSDAVTELDVRAVHVPPSGISELGIQINVEDLVRRQGQILIVASTDDLNDYGEADIGGQIYRVTSVHELTPNGRDRILWYLEVQR